MKKHNISKTDLLVNQAVIETWRLALTIALTVLYHKGGWSAEDLEQFVDFFWDWVMAYNNNRAPESADTMTQNESAVELVKQMFNETKIDIEMK